MFLPAERLARISRRPGPLPRLAIAASQRLARLVSDVDRVVLDGVVEGLALLGMGAGWLVAWCDRRGLDAAERGLLLLAGTVGRCSRQLAEARPAHLMFWLGALAMALLVLGRSA